MRAFFFVVATFALIACGGSDDASVDAAGAANDSGAQGVVALVNASARATRVYACGGECTDIVFRFELQNNTSSSIANLEGLFFTVGEGASKLEMSASFGLGVLLCTNAPWQLAPAETSQTITVLFLQEAAASQDSELTYPCGASANTTTGALDRWGQTRPLMGAPVSISVRGVGWRADGVTALQ